jgi:hypothetical protein
MGHGPQLPGDLGTAALPQATVAVPRRAGPLPRAMCGRRRIGKDFPHACNDPPIRFQAEPLCCESKFSNGALKAA